jgi:type I restriction enzyme S subunit
MSFNTVTIAEIAAPDKRSIAIGPFGSSLKADLYVPSGVPVVRGQNIKDAGELDESDLVFVEPETAARFPACLLNEGDLVFPHRGAIGRVGIVGKRQMLLSSSMMKLTVDPLKADPRFVFYYFRGPGKHELLMRASTVGTPGIGQPLTSLRGISIQIPELDQQRAIAKLLGALDDKIAANTNLAATAEELATAEFHRRVLHVPFSDQTFADLAKVSGGGTPSTAVSEYWNGDVRWATPTDVTGLQGPYLTDTSRRISEAGLNACASELYPAGSILMTSRATIGAFALAREPMAVNQGFIVVQPHNPDLRLWLFHEMQSRIDEFISLANGATFLELSRGNFKKFKVRLADAQVMKEFVALAKPIHEMAANALLENARLSAIRDTLLPRLVAGDLRVKEAEKALAEAAV